MSKYAFARLADLRERNGVIKEIRGKGLMIGIELTHPGAGVVSRCLDKGVYINCTHDTVLRFMPPMIVTRKELDLGIDALDEALTEEFGA
jgi:acetylornithine/succinyldiaminopimelate/putrescine aminotransferase